MSEVAFGLRTGVSEPAVEIELEHTALVALLDRAAALRSAAALVPSQVGLEVGVAAERIDHLDTLSVCAVAGTRTDALLDLVVPAGVGLIGNVAVVRRPAAIAGRHVAGGAHEFDTFWEQEGIAAAVAVPIVSGEWFYGVLCGATRQPREFDDRAVAAMVRLADEVAVAIEVADHAHEMVEIALNEERRYLALTLQDSVGAMLFSIGAAARELDINGEDSAPVLRARLKYIEGQVATTAAQLRQALRAFSEVPRDVPLGVDLRTECRDLEERTGLKARCVVLGDLPPIDDRRAKILVLAAREALLNVEQHASARSVVVSLHAADGGVSLMVADDGTGLNSGLPGAAGRGLEATSKRLARVGGHCLLVTNEDGGCSMRAWIPC